MNPWMPSISCLLSHGAVESVVKGLRVRRHLRLEHLHFVRSEELVNRVARVLQIAEITRAGRTHLHACRLQSFGDAVVTERALVGRVCLRIDVTASIRARLDTVTAPEAV